MGVREDFKEGFRRLWKIGVAIVVIVTLCRLALMIPLTVVTEGPYAILFISLIMGILIAVPLLYFVIYRLGWLVIEWVYNGFAGIKKSN